MKYDLTAVPTDIAYKILASTVLPRPIAWVTTRGADGIVNAAPYSFFNAVGSNPPTLVLGLLKDAVRGFKDTARNILDSGEFVVNLVPERLAGAMNLTCMDAPSGVSEIDIAGLATTASDVVGPPRITESPVAFECRTLASMVTGPQQTLVVARVLVAHVDDRFILDAGRAHVDSPAMGLIGRLHGAGWYTRTADTFQMARPTYARWIAERRPAPAQE